MSCRSRRDPVDAFARPILAVLAALLLATAFAGASPARAQVLTGRVVDEASGDPLPGANVLLRERSSTQLARGTATGPDGRFRFDALDPGRYRLEIGYLGYADYSRELTVRTGDTVRVSVELTASALPQEEIVVTSRRADPRLTPVTASNLTAAEIEARSSMKDLPALLADLPSTTFYSQNGNGMGYSVLRMRGFGQERIAVSVNGVPQNDPENFNVFWINFFDLKGSVQDVQVQRGAAASSYGSTAVAGAINVVARPYRPEPYGRVELGAGSFGTRRYTVEANTGRVADRYVAYGRFSRLVSDGYRDWSWTEYDRYFVGVSRYGERSTLTVQSYGGPQRDGLAFFGVPKSANDDPVARRANPSADAEPVPYFAHRGPVERFHQPHLTVHHSWQWAPNAHLDQRLFWIKGEGYFDFSVNFRSPEFLRLPGSIEGLEAGERALPLFLALPEADVKQRGYLDQHQVGWLPEVTWRHDGGRTTVGLEARLHRSRRWGRIQAASPVIPDSLVGPEPDRKLYAFRGEKVIASTFGQHLWRPGDRWAVHGELKLTYRRYRHYEERFFGRRFAVPYLFAQPRLGVRLFPERPWSAYLSVAYAQREPQLDHLYDADAAGAGAAPRFARRPDGSYDYDAPLVEPESLLDVELGSSLRRSRFRAKANLYWMEFWNELVPSGGVDQFGNPRVGNADRSRHAGLELQASGRILPGWDVSANASFSRSRLVDYAEYVSTGEGARRVDRSGNPVPGFPDRMAHLQTRYERGPFRARLSLSYTGTQYVGTSGGENRAGEWATDRIVDPYTMLDGALAFAPEGGPWLSGLELTLQGHNLLDRRVLRYGYESSAGPRFFPTATRHFFVRLRYTLR